MTPGHTPLAPQASRLTIRRPCPRRRQWLHCRKSCPKPQLQKRARCPTADSTAAGRTVGNKQQRPHLSAAKNCCVFARPMRARVRPRLMGLGPGSTIVPRKVPPLSQASTSISTCRVVQVVFTTHKEQSCNGHQQKRAQRQQELQSATCPALVTQAPCATCQCRQAAQSDTHHAASLRTPPAEADCDRQRNAAVSTSSFKATRPHSPRAG